VGGVKVLYEWDLNIHIGHLDSQFIQGIKGGIIVLHAEHLIANKCSR